MEYIDQDEDAFKGRPTIRVWELNENSTRYDRIAAAPSDEEMTGYWYAWAVISSAVGIFSMVVFLGILSSKKARSNAFNLYLLYLMVPDFVFSLCCGVTCLVNAVMGQYSSPWMCNFQQWYSVFGIAANTWLNMLVAQQIYLMLCYSHVRRRYSTPSLRYISMQALVVYAFCGFLGTWGLFEKENFPFHTGAFSGLACLPIETDSASTWFFWFCFIPLFAGIPFACIGYMSFDIWWRSLMPPSGRRRTLSVYFGRLILVFVVMWVPTFVFLWVAGPWLPPSVHFAAGTWSHLQGAVSAGVSLMKPDILGAVKNFLRCQCVADEIAPTNAPPVEGRGSSRWNFDIGKSFRSSKFGSPALFGGEKKDVFVSGFSMDDIIVEGDEENQTSTISLTATPNPRISSTFSAFSGAEVWPSSYHEPSQPLVEEAAASSAKPMDDRSRKSQEPSNNDQEKLGQSTSRLAADREHHFNALSGPDLWPDENAPQQAADDGASHHTAEVSLFGEGFAAELAKEEPVEASIKDFSDELATQERGWKSAVGFSDDDGQKQELVVQVSDEGAMQEQGGVTSEGVSDVGAQQEQVFSTAPKEEEVSNEIASPKARETEEEFLLRNQT